MANGKLTPSEGRDIEAQIMATLRACPARFITTYQLWARLQAARPGLAARLEDVYGHGVGKGAGAHYRATSWIAHRLGRRYRNGRELVREWLDTRGLGVGRGGATGRRTSMFRVCA